MTAIIFLVILVVIAVVLIGMYNSLVQLRVRCDSAWSDVDVQLKRLAIEITGNESKINKFLKLMENFGISDLTRTGKVAMARVE